MAVGDVASSRKQHNVGMTLQRGYQLGQMRIRRQFGPVLFSEIVPTVFPVGMIPFSQRR